MFTNSTIRKIFHAIIGGTLILAFLLGGFYVYIRFFDVKMYNTVAELGGQARLYWLMQDLSAANNGAVVDYVDYYSPTSSCCIVYPVDSSGKAMRTETLFPHITNLTLLVRDGELSDISPLKGLNLNGLSVQGNKIKDFSAIESMEELTGLDLVDTGMKKLPDFTKLSLGSLNIDHNQISSLEPISHMDGLRGLWAANNNITDLSPLIGKIYLEELDLTNNQITDLFPLMGLERLQSLILAGNPLKDLSRLFPGGFKRQPLFDLDISNTKVSDLSPLVGKPIDKVDITGTPAAKLPLPEGLWEGMKIVGHEKAVEKVATGK